MDLLQQSDCRGSPTLRPQSECKSSPMQNQFNRKTGSTKAARL